VNAKVDDDKRGDSNDVREFLDRLYWILGTFCFGWSLSAVVGILRRHPLDLPILGKADFAEIIIFTLLAFSLLIPLLLYVVATWRSAAAVGHWRARFPGAPADKLEIPWTFIWLRALLFVMLVGGSVATMQLCYQRMLGLEIQWLGGVNKVVLCQENPPGFTLFDFPSKPDPEKDYANWRWIGPPAEDQTDRDQEKMLAKDDRSKITAFPGYMPWTFRLISYGSIAIVLWFLFAPPRTLRTWLSCNYSRLKSKLSLSHHVIEFRE
jgi:hypothetical protein